MYSRDNLPNMMVVWLFDMVELCSQFAKLELESANKKKQMRGQLSWLKMY